LRCASKSRSAYDGSTVAGAARHAANAGNGPEDNRTGYTGFIHPMALDHCLKDHPAPEDCEFYLCGPPMMNAAVLKMLDDLGVDPENILLDDFGG